MTHEWILLYRFHTIYTCRKKLDRLYKIIYKYFKDKYGRRSKYGVQIKKNYETRNYF